jgi:hypothetical protein
MFGLTPSKSDKFFEHADLLVRSFGKKEACRLLKDYCVVAIKLATGQPFSVDQTGIWVATDDSGFPRSIGQFKKALRTGSLAEKRAVITILSAYRLLRTEPTMDLSSITELSNSPQKLPHRLQQLFVFACRKMRKRIGEDIPMDTAFHLSSKSGPNGPVLETIGDDAKALMRDPKLLEAWRTLTAATQSGTITDVGYGKNLLRGLPNSPCLGPIDNRLRRRESLLLEAANSVAKKPSPVHSRLAAIAAGG